MGTPVDLEAMIAMFRDSRTHLAVAKVLSTELASDNSTLLVDCQFISHERKSVARATWDATGPDAGSFQFPQVDDIVLLAFSEGDEGQSFVIGRMTSKVDKIPSQAKEGHMVHRALAGKKLHLCSDTRVNIGKGSDTQPTEPLVLGQKLIDNLTALYSKLDTLLTNLQGPLQLTTAPGSPTSPNPAFVAQLVALQGQLTADKTQYLDTASTNIVSQLAFTERGT